MQGLLGAASPGLDAHALLKANVAAVPKTLPVLSLAFVYHNIIPVIATSLEVSLEYPGCLSIACSPSLY